MKPSTRYKNVLLFALLFSCSFCIHAERRDGKRGEWRGDYPETRFVNRFSPEAQAASAGGNLRSTHDGLGNLDPPDDDEALVPVGDACWILILAFGVYAFYLRAKEVTPETLIVIC
jgi:hypothetical protein